MFDKGNFEFKLDLVTNKFKCLDVVTPLRSLMNNLLWIYNVTQKLHFASL